MACLPRRESHRNRSRLDRESPVSVPCFFLVHNKGPDRAERLAERKIRPAHRTTTRSAHHQHAELPFVLLWFLQDLSMQRSGPWGRAAGMQMLRSTETAEALQFVAPPHNAVPVFFQYLVAFTCFFRKPPERSFSRRVKGSVLLFASLFTIPLARQSCLDAALLTGFQVVGVTLDFLDDVLLLYLPLEPAQRIFQRFAFLNANLSQNFPPPNLPVRLFMMITDFCIAHTKVFPRSPVLDLPNLPNLPSFLPVLPVWMCRTAERICSRDRRRHLNFP